MKQSSPLEIPLGQHALVCGGTGSGKTRLMIELARHSTAPVIVYDTKIEPAYDDVALSDDTRVEIIEGGLVDFQKFLQRSKRKTVDYIIVRPPSSETVEPLLLDEYLQAHYEHGGGMMAMIDEGYQFHDSGRAGMGLVNLLTRGRSRRISTVVGTQRPSWISRFCFTEARHYFIYRLIDVKDRKRIAELSPYPVHKMLDNFKFWHYVVGEEFGTEFAPLTLRGYSMESEQPAKINHWL